MNFSPLSFILLPNVFTQSRSWHTFSSVVHLPLSVVCFFGSTKRRTRMAFMPCSLKNVSTSLTPSPSCEKYFAPASSYLGSMEMSPPAYFCAEAEVEARSSIENKIFIVFINLCVSYVLQGAAPVAVRNRISVMLSCVRCHSGCVS